MPFLLVQHFQLRVMQHFKIEFAIKFYFQFVYLEKVFLQGKCVPQKVINMARHKLWNNTKRKVIVALNKRAAKRYL